MRVLVREGETVLADLFFEDEQIRAGSDPGCEIHLPDMRVSEVNALIGPSPEGTWHIENPDPDNRISVNTHVVTERTLLENGDEIKIHDYVLKIYLHAEMELGRHEKPEEIRLSAEELARITQFPLPPNSVVKRGFDTLTLTNAQVAAAGRAALEVFGSRDIHELVDVTLRMLLKTFHARVAWIGIRRTPEGELEVLGGRLPSGQTCETTPIIEQLQYRCVERGQHICVRKVREQEQIGSAICVPLRTDQGQLGMVYVDRARRASRFQIPDLDLLTTVGGVIAAKLEALVQGRLQRDAAVSSTEVSVVHAIQAQLDPKAAPVWKNLQMAAYSRSGQENPGDVYDVMKHPDSELTSFLVGHVNATGASLALSMARLHSTFRVGFLHKDQPHALARALNWLMYDEKDASTIDAVFLMIDPGSGNLRYCRAGKIGAFIMNGRGEPRPLLGADAPSIGQVRNHQYNSLPEKLAPGETLVIYSRGVASAVNIKGERFGEKRFIETVCDGFGELPATIVQDVSHELSTFFADGRHPDDITFLMLHRTEE